MDIRQLLEAIMQIRQNNPQAWDNRSKDPNFVPNAGPPKPINPRDLATGPLGGWDNDVSRTGDYNPPVQPATPSPEPVQPAEPRGQVDPGFSAPGPRYDPRMEYKGDRTPTGGANGKMNDLKRQILNGILQRR